MQELFRDCAFSQSVVHADVRVIINPMDSVVVPYTHSRIDFKESHPHSAINRQQHLMQDTVLPVLVIIDQDEVHANARNGVLAGAYFPNFQAKGEGSRVKYIH